MSGKYKSLLYAGYTVELISVLQTSSNDPLMMYRYASSGSNREAHKPLNACVDTISIYRLESNEAVLNKNRCPAVSYQCWDNDNANTVSLNRSCLAIEFVIFCISREEIEREEGEDRCIRDQLLIAICYCVRHLFPNNLSSQSRGSL